MFNDEEPFAFKKMHELSTVDGFVEVSECLADMIKYLANEPSVGLFYVQQHTQNAVPNLINLRNNVAEKSREMTLDTEDSEDSISMIRSMRECGFPIADEMIRDIKSSLAIMSVKQPKRGLISSPSSGFNGGRTGSWGPVAWGGQNPYSSAPDIEKATNYLSNVLNSAKLKASNFKWPQTESNKSQAAKNETPISHLDRPLSASICNIPSNMLDTDPEVLPLSIQLGEELREVEVDKITPHDELHSLVEKYDDFKADKEAKLQEWLGDARN